jgi:hypothetical protein
MAVVGSPDDFFEEELKMVQAMPLSADQKDKCRHMLSASAVATQEGSFKWLGMYEELPFLVFEIGGTQGRLFCRAFLESTFSLSLSFSCSHSLALSHSLSSSLSLSLFLSLS